MAHRSVFKGYYALRFKVLQRDNFTCQYCGQKAPSVLLEVDHIKAVEDGGTDTEDNLVTSCGACNRGKAALSIILNRTKARNHMTNRTAKAFDGSEFMPTSPRRDELLQILKEKGPLTSIEVAKELNISKVYAYILTNRYRKRGAIQKIDGKWRQTTC